MRRMYSENQLVKVLENKDIVAKTLKQTQPNFKLDISESNFNWGNDNLEGENVFGVVEEINGVIYFVISHKVTNTSESTISLPNPSMTIDLPKEISKKIIDFDGKSVNESNNRVILGFQISRGSTAYPDALNDRCPGVLQNTLTANRLYVTMFPSVSINAGSTMFFSIRFFITTL